MGGVDLGGLLTWFVGSDPAFHAFFLRLLIVEVLIVTAFTVVIGPFLSARWIDRNARKTYVEQLRPELTRDLAATVVEVRHLVAGAEDRLKEALPTPEAFEALLEERAQETEAKVHGMLKVALEDHTSRLPPAPDVAGLEARLLEHMRAGLASAVEANKAHVNDFIRQLQEQAAAEASSDHGRELAKRSAEARANRKVDMAAAETGLAAALAERGFGPYLPIARQLMGEEVWQTAVKLYAAGDAAGVNRILTPMLQLAQRQQGQTMTVPSGAEQAGPGDFVSRFG